MARRNDHTEQQIKDMSLEALDHLLEFESIEDISLRSLAKHIGYAPSTLVRLFGSWSMLLLEYNVGNLSKLLEQLQAATSNKVEPTSQLKRLAECYWHYAVHQRHKWRLIFQHRLEENTQLPSKLDSLIASMFALVEEVFSQLNPGNQNEAKHGAKILWASVHGIVQLDVDNKLDLLEDLKGTQAIHYLINHFVRSWTQSSPAQQGDHHE